MVELKTSFIPQRPIIPQERKTQSAPVSLATTISIILFFLLLTVSGGLYFYKVALEQSIETMSESLDRAREAIEPSLVADLKRLDTRMQVASSLLGSHIIVSSVFKLLEDLTLKSVQFEQFVFTMTNGADAKITLSGKARGYSSLALQSDVFGEDVNIKEPIFSNLGLDREGRVAFSFSSPINKNLLLFRGNLGTVIIPVQSAPNANP